MRRILLALTAAALMVAVLAVSALPALAQGPGSIPPQISTGAEHALPNVDDTPVISIEPNVEEPCLVHLSTPGHDSTYPDEGCF